MKAASFTDILRTSKNPKEVKILIIIVTHAIAMYTRVWPSNYLCIVVWSQYVYVAGANPIIC